MSESILIIEDDEIQRTLVTEMLVTFISVDIHEAGDCDEAMAVLAENSIAIAVKIREYQNMISRQQADLEAKVDYLEQIRVYLEESQE